jgi:hypothetical protein
VHHLSARTVAVSFRLAGLCYAAFLGIVPGCASEQQDVITGPTAESPDRAASLVRVGPPETVLSAKERPYSWPDGTMGLLRDGSKYRFVAASAGFPKTAVGTLQNPIAEGVWDLKIEGLKKPYDYVAGGPLYRDEPSGVLLMFYHAEFYTFPPGYLPFYSEIGLARSMDEGRTWTDLGVILTLHTPIQAPYFQVQRESLDIGWGAYTVVGEYFYVYFADLIEDGESYGRVHHAVARAPIADVLRAAIENGTVSAWTKYYNGTWSEPGLGGKSSSLLQHGRGFLMLGDVSYNSYLSKYVAVLIGEPWPNTDLYWIESEDGLHWTHYHKIVDDPGHEIYVTIVGTGDQLRQSGKEFYVYYVHSFEFAETGDRNKDGRLMRRRLTVQ